MESKLKEKVLRLLKSRCRYWTSIDDIFVLLKNEYSKTSIYSTVYDLQHEGAVEQKRERMGVKKVPTLLFKYVSIKNRKK